MPSKVVADRIKNRAVPALAVHDGERALDFYAKAFGAKEVSKRIPWEGKIGHAEIEIEGAHVMLADEFLLTTRVLRPSAEHLSSSTSM